jgi:hypothetical protein
MRNPTSVASSYIIFNQSALLAAPFSFRPGEQATTGAFVLCGFRIVGSLHVNTPYAPPYYQQGIDH